MRVLKIKTCILAVFAACVFLFAGCRKKDNSVELVLNAESVVITVGEDYGLQANLEDVSWASEDKTVAKVDGRGKIVGLSVGTTKIVASLKDARAECLVEVKPREVVDAYSVSLDQTTAALKTSGTLKLTATVFNLGEACGETAAFSSENESVATVSADGTVTARAVGETVIKASYGSAYAACRIVVSDGAVQIVLNATTAKVRLGETEQLTASVWKNGEKTNEEVVWVTDSAKASISADGTVTGMALGDVTVTAKYGEESTYCRVRVYQTATISTVEDFLRIRDDQYTDYELVNDLEFSDYSWNTANIVRKLSSSLDGNGHKLYGLKRTEAADQVGIFGEIAEGACVENLAVYVDEFVYANGCGAFAVENNGSIRNCYFKLYTYAKNTDRSVMLRSGLTHINRGEMSGLLVDVTAYQGTTKTVIFNAYSAINYGTIERSIVISEQKRIVEETENETKVNYISYQLLSGTGAIAALDMTGYYDIYRPNNAEDKNRDNTLIFLTVEHLLGIGSNQAYYAFDGEAAAVPEAELDSIKVTDTAFREWFDVVWEFSETEVRFHGVTLYSV